MRPPSWDKHEAAILLAGLLATINGEVTRAEAIKNISEDLRNMALKRGVEIDSVYRNENGISFQMQSMESAYYGRTVFKPATKLFLEVATIYRESKDDFYKLLEEANAMINGTSSVENEFMQYLANKVSPAQLSALYPCYAVIETFCLKIKVLQNPLFQTVDFEIIKKVQRTIEQNKIFKITHKREHNKIVAAGRYYYIYIKEGRYLGAHEESNTATLSTNGTVHEETSISVGRKSSTLLKRSDQDERLWQKYPVVYERLFNTLKDSFSENTNGLSISEMNAKISYIARPSVIEEILDNVSWASAIGEKYIFSNDVVDHHIVINEPDNKSTDTILSDNTLREIDFNGTFDLSYTKPKEFRYFGDIKTAGNSWTSLYVNFMAAIIEDYPHIFNHGMSFSKRNGRIELANNDDHVFMYVPKAIPGTDYVLETNISANNMVSKIKYILDLCNIDYENVVIKYSKKSATSEPEDSQINTPSRPVMTNTVNSTSFFHYLSTTLRMAESTCRSYSSAINNCEAFAKEHHLSSCNLYTDNTKEAQETVKLLLSNTDFLDYNARQHNRFRAALQKFLLFIGGSVLPITPENCTPDMKLPYENKFYEEVLKQYFKKGFRMDSPLEIRKFRRYYMAIHGAELIDPDEIISKNIAALCIVYDGKAFLPEVMLSENLKEQLLEYIDTAFSNGKTAIYYQAIYTEFSDSFLDYHIHNADMLKAYLAFVGNGRFYVNRSFISKEPNVVLDPLSEIRSCLQEYGRPVEYNELFNSLPHLPQSKIKFILASNREFVNNGHSTYFHESIIRLSDDELKGISEIIQQTISDKEFIGGNELYDAIQAKYPYILEGHQNISFFGFRDALKAKLGNSFSFKGNIISRLGQELSMADVFAKYASSHENFSLSELQGIASSLATPIYFDSVYENSLRISRDQFVSKDSAQFPVCETDKALDRICVGKYMPILGVTNFGGFPYAGFSWNSFLLEHYVADYSTKYMLLHSSFNGTECAGAIVKRSAGIGSFDDLIVDLLANSQIEMEKNSVLQFLSDQGYLARRRYSGVESLIIKASAQRQRKDND